ncbi:MAG TPA: efflux RND transporter periplasmic adaptor subunit [Terriglobia bacterium]|nr:efflux RND transporter periplasmic adaptor subunit [Terriglobia bacterium]
MRKRLLPIGAALLVLLFFSYRYYSNSRIDPSAVRASGTIEATTVDVSFQIGGRVVEVLPREGQPVRAGDVLARLADEENEVRVRQAEAALEGTSSQTKQQQTALEQRESLVSSQIRQAHGQAEAARAMLDRLRHGSRPEEIRVAEAELAQAQAALEPRKLEFQRAAGLFEDGLVSQQQFDTARAAFRTAEATVTVARQRLTLATEGPRQEDIAEAQARLSAAEATVSAAEAARRDIEIQREGLVGARARQREISAQLDAARLQLAYTELRSPIDGVVLTRNIEVGEIVNAGSPVVTVADIDNLWINLYVPETQTGRIHLGQTAQVQVDAFPGERFKGTVTFISSESEFTPKTIQTEEERIKLVYRVKVALESGGQRLKPGMPADAAIGD